MDMLLSLSMAHGNQSSLSQNQLVDALLNKGVLVQGQLEKAMRAVDRIHFVDCQQVEQVYSDKPGKRGNVKVTAPHMHAIALAALLKDELQYNDAITCVDLGCGSGYVASLFRKLFPNAEIFAVDHENVLNVSRTCLEKQFGSNIGEIQLLSPESWGKMGTKMDRCHVGFGITMDAMRNLQSLLSLSGRMTVPVGDQGTEQELLLVDAHNNLQKIIETNNETDDNTSIISENSTKVPSISENILI
jgi:protein-L-isoaspartate O-methyltransferase